MMEDLYSIFTFEPMRNFYPGVSNLSRNCLVQYISFEDVSSHPSGPSAREKRLSLLRMSLQRACNDILSHFEKQYALPGFHVNFAKTGKRAHLNGLFTRNGLRGML